MYVDAVLAVEDKRFYRHPGIDPIAIGRALFNDIRAGAYVEGGSTITQQLAKNQYFTQDKKIVRKVAEMFMAFKIESTLDKDKIFELYVNSILAISSGLLFNGVADTSITFLSCRLPSACNVLVLHNFCNSLYMEAVSLLNLCASSTITKS